MIDPEAKARWRILDRADLARLDERACPTCDATPGVPCSADDVHDARIAWLHEETSR